MHLKQVISYDAYNGSGKIVRSYQVRDNDEDLRNLNPPPGSIGEIKISFVRYLAPTLSSEKQPNVKTIRPQATKPKPSIAPAAPLLRASERCESGHWVMRVMNNGGLVELEDGSIWQIDALDTIDSMLWLPTEGILVCGQSQLINADNGDQVNAVRLR